MGIKARGRDRRRKRMNKWFKMLNLRFFDAEGAAAGGSGEGAAGEATAASAELSETTVHAAGERRAKNPLADVKYGIQEEDEEMEDAADPEETAEAEEDKEAEPESFETLIRGKYKAEYDKSVQSILARRLKSAKAAEAAQQKSAPIFQALADKYGVDASDLDGLLEKIQDDNSLYEEKAVEAGMTVEQYKKFANTQRENRMLREQQEAAEREAESRRVFQGWVQEAESMKETYPNLDFEEELRNQDVTELLSRGVPFKTAYEVAHHDEIMQGTIQYAVNHTRKATAESIRNRQSRPVENGMSVKGAAPVKRDVSKFTKEDRAEIIRRVQNGEMIRF
jgi:hypothetical protein